MTGPDARVVVLVTEGCHLCADACAVVSSICADLSVPWMSRDLADVDEATRARWREYVPVVMVDHAVHDIFRVDPDRLRAALTG
jgi:hypothetical protein